MTKSEPFVENEFAHKNLGQRLEFEKRISELSGKFINIPWQDIDAEIELSLKNLVEFLDFERGTILELDETNNLLSLTHQYAKPGVRLSSASFNSKKDVPWFHAELMAGRTIVFTNRDDIPKEAIEERELSKNIPFKSSISIPLIAGGKITGALGFNSESYLIDWQEELIERLKFVGIIFTNAISRKNAESKLFLINQRLEDENILLRQELNSEYNFNNIIGQSDAMKYVFYKIKQVAPVNTTVLIEGETGVGKQLFAFAIHQASHRKDFPLIKLNCASLPANLIESELFGHEKGSFTGADKTVKGRFEIADGGTLFLDEIGELGIELQAKLLRVLQDGEFERLGSSKTIKTDVRIIAATNRLLKNEVQEGRFRKDLYYRLSAFPITIPPLRYRKEDIMLLVEHYINKFAKEMGKKISSVSKDAMDKLTAYSWPGNVRELENVIERAVVTNNTAILTIHEDLELIESDSSEVLTLEENERRLIISTLKKTGGKIHGKTGVAELLGINANTLRSRMSKLGIPLPKSGY